METILKISEIELESESGFEVTTDKQVLQLVISNYQNCCENWGYFLSNDDLDSFIGAKLLSVSLTDTELVTHQLSEHAAADACTMFVNIETSTGTLQFTAYNEHNGYYGHAATVRSTQLTHQEYL